MAWMYASTVDAANPRNRIANNTASRNAVMTDSFFGRPASCRTPLESVYPPANAETASPFFREAVPFNGHLDVSARERR